ncbi:MAG: exosortase/archaeosortase family protein [Deltaproteobacteria bacterium]|nr:exosortase/archaeosortase family protein [Deltaproteobacteria bacterium]
MNRRDWVLVGLLAGVFTPAVLAMAEVWRSVGYYSHGFLIPLVSYAAFHPIAGRLGATGRDLRGYLVVLAALGIYLLGIGAGSTLLQGLGFVVAVAGVVLAFWGPAGLRRLAFPVWFLLFMVPLPPELLAPLIVKLQLVVSGASVEILQTLGYSVLREGNVLVLPGGKSLFGAGRRRVRRPARHPERPARAGGPADVRADVSGARRDRTTATQVVPGWRRSVGGPRGKTGGLQPRSFLHSLRVVGSPLIKCGRSERRSAATRGSRPRRVAIERRFSQ